MPYEVVDGFSYYKDGETVIELKKQVQLRIWQQEHKVKAKSVIAALSGINTATGRDTMRFAQQGEWPINVAVKPIKH